MNLSDKIRMLREEKRYSQTEFSKLIGVKNNTVWRWENGKAKPNANFLIKIAKTLGVDISLLTDDTVNETFTITTPEVKEQTFKGDKGSIIYHFANGEKIEFPATVSLIPEIKKLITQRATEINKEATNQ